MTLCSIIVVLVLISTSFFINDAYAVCPPSCFQSLAETLTSSDPITKSITKQLSESLTSSDTVSTTAAKKTSLAESLTSSDTVSTKIGKLQSLAESLTSSDTVSATGPKKASLSETLTSSDSISSPSFPSTTPIIRSGGGNSANTVPPSFSGSAFSATEYPFSLGGTGYQLPSYANTIPTTTFQTGNPVKVSLLLYSNSGSDAIQHIALYTNLHGLNSDIPQSDTYIIYEKGQPIQIVDPNKFFSRASVSVSQIGNKLQVTFDVTFAKPMGTSHIDLRVWDTYLNTVDTKILNAWQVVQSTPLTNPPSSAPTTPSPTTTAPTVQNKIPDLMPVIKEWGGYSPTSISDSELLANMGIKGNFIPPWFMKTTKWVVNDEISEQEFVNAIKYMYQIRIIK
ncbi:MAG TPA: hypothetical protein VGR54_07245 [Nitrosopumilaceae archaeon]|nr:hypothetical protein [Nitrosopumilaceae archaeon]